MLVSDGLNHNMINMTMGEGREGREEGEVLMTLSSSHTQAPKIVTTGGLCLFTARHVQHTEVTIVTHSYTVLHTMDR